MKDAVATMGNVLPDDAGGRDAVHVAVFSAVCPTQVFPSQHVSVVDPEPANARGDTAVSSAEGIGPRCGVVDPFLSAPVPAGVRFWVYLYPRTITALSHRWSHPAFEGTTGAAYATPGSKAVAEAWLRDFIGRTDCPSYNTTLALAEDFLMGRSDGDDEYLIVIGQDASGEIPDEFWDHAAAVLGVQRPVKCPTYFSCSC